MYDVLDKLIGPLSAHINALLSQPISGTDDQRAHIETKKAFLALLNNIMASQLRPIFISERVYIYFYCILTSFSNFLIGNSAGFERLIETMQQLIEDISDPGSQKVAVIFLSRCVTVWGRETNEALPGFDRFIYERLVPTAFRVPSLPGFNTKDGQMMVVSLFHQIFIFYLPLNR
jgi:exportin-T